MGWHVGSGSQERYEINNSSGVVIEAEGDPLALQAFQQALTEERPSQAAVDRIDVESLPVADDSGFAFPAKRTGRTMPGYLPTSRPASIAFMN